MRGRRPSICTWAICPFQPHRTNWRTLFGTVGEVTSAQVVTDRETGRSRGFGFVEMADEDARKAIDELTGTDARWPADHRQRGAPAQPAPRHATTATAATDRPQLVTAPVSAPCTSLAYLPSTPLV